MKCPQQSAPRHQGSRAPKLDPLSTDQKNIIVSNTKITNTKKKGHITRIIKMEEFSADL